MKTTFQMRGYAWYIKDHRYPLSYFVIRFFTDSLNIEQALSSVHTTINEITYYHNHCTSYSKREMCEIKKREL
jgi:hypothetical protein